MPEPLHMQGQIPHYPLNRRLSTQRWPGLVGRREKYLAHAGN